MRKLLTLLISAFILSTLAFTFSACENVNNNGAEASNIYSVYLRDGEVDDFSVETEPDGTYNIVIPEKVGYDFVKLVDSNGNDFPLQGKITKDVIVYEVWQIKQTADFNALKTYIEGGADRIYLTADIVLTDSIYVFSETEIYSDADRTLTRSENFGGELFVVGENSDGESPILFGNNAKLTVKPLGENTITFDGNKANMLTDVNGSAFLLLNSATLNIHDGVIIKDFSKTQNLKLNDEKYKLSETFVNERIGGAAVTVTSSCAFNMYGGEISGCEVSGVAGETQSSNLGGAIFNYNTANIYGGEIKNCSAARGGAIYNYRTLRIYDGKISDNNATEYGGAIYLANSQYCNLSIGLSSATDVDKTTCFETNTSELSGGAIFGGYQTSAVIYNAEFIENAAGNNGGAINTPGSLSVYNTIFNKNTANSTSGKGGAIFVYASEGSNTVREVSFTSCNFIENVANFNGGAICLGNRERAVKASLRDCNFIKNSAGTSGGAIFNRNNETVDESTITVIPIVGGSFAENRAGTSGGAVYLYNSKVEINGSEYMGNIATSTDSIGGAMAIYHGSVANISGITLTGSSAITNGGAIYISSSTVTIEDSELSENNANGNGGAVGVYSSANLIMNNNIFSENTAVGNGGAVYVSGSTVNMKKITATKNSSSGTGGGFMYATSAGTVKITDITSSENQAAQGKSIYLTITNTKVYIYSGSSSNEFESGKYAIWSNTSNARLYIKGKLTGEYYSFENGSIGVKSSTAEEYVEDILTEE